MSPSDRFIAQACDPRLAPLAFAVTPAWLLSADGTRILWCNAQGSAYFGAAAPSDLTAGMAGGAAAGRELAALFPRLPMDGKPQLARLRALSPSKLGTPVTCVCRRMRSPDGEAAILVTAEPPKQALPVAECVRRALAGGNDLAAFDANGDLIFAGEGAATRLSGLTSLAAAGTAIGEATLHQFGEGDAAVTVARLPASAPAETRSSEMAPECSGVEEKHLAPPPPPSLGGLDPDSEPESDNADRNVSGLEEVAKRLITRRHPLRFVWRMEADGAFTVQEGEFTALVGEPTARMQGKHWDEVSAALNLDPLGSVAGAIAARETWSGVHIEWPLEGTNDTLPVALSGLPALDSARTFLGYRGFGVCRDVDRIAAAIAARRAQAAGGEAPAKPSVAAADAQAAEDAPQEDDRAADVFAFTSPREARPALTLVPLAKNVVPLRAGIASDVRPALSPLEQTAFQDIARALGARLEGDGASMIAQVASPLLPPNADDEPSAPGYAQEAERLPERAILDRLPQAIVVFRADEILFVNRSLLDWTKIESIEGITAAGGLDALFIDRAGPQAADVEGSRRSLLLRRADGQAIMVQAQLLTLTIADAPAAMLVLTRTKEEPDAPPRRAQAPVSASGNDPMRDVLDLISEAIVLVGKGGRIAFANAKAAALFDYEPRSLAQMPFLELISVESRSAVDECLGQTKRRTDEPAKGRAVVVGRTRQGGTMPLTITLRRTGDDPDRFCAVFHDRTPSKQANASAAGTESQSQDARSESAALLSTISHEIRTPLNAIVGFAEIMAEERLGSMGNDRYHGYARDIHASARQIVSVLDDMLDLSEIEAGRLDLSFEHIDLNEMMQRCVAIKQPQASRERIVIRCALAPALPYVSADARSIRQILLNLLANSIKFTGAGGQVILSTALTDAGEAVLRVRDTGIGLSEDEIAAALKPFRTPQAGARGGAAGEGLNLSLTKALAEANGAQFRIKSAINAGTLVEIVFPAQRVVRLERTREDGSG